MQIHTAPPVSTGARLALFENITASDTIRIGEQSPVRRILFSEAVPSFTRREIAMGIYSLEGILAATIHYIGENGAYEAVSAEIPFAASGECDAASGEIFCRVNVSNIEATNIRGRRIDFGAALVIEGFIFAEAKTREPIECEGIAALCTNKSKRTLSSVRRIEAVQNLSFEYPIEDAARVLFSGASVCDVSRASSGAGVMQSGTLKISIVYATSGEQSSCRSINQTEAWNLFAEAPYGFPIDEYIGKVTVSGVRTSIVEGEGESLTLLCDVTLCADVLLASRADFDIVDDLFSPQLLLVPEFTATEHSCVGEGAEQTVDFSASAQLHSSGVLCKVVYSSVNVNLSCYNADNALEITGAVTGYVLVAQSDKGDFEAAELNAEFAVSFSGLCGEDALFTCEMVSLNATANGTSVGIEGRVHIRVLPVCRESVLELTDLTVSEYPAEETDCAQLVVYFVEDERGLYRAAKENRVLPETLRAENGLPEPIGSRQAVTVKKY